MIVIEQETDLLKVHVYGEMTIEDFREFEARVMEELDTYDSVDLLFDLGNMTGFSVDVALEEVRFSKAHAQDYRRVAVVTDDQWLVWVTWLAGRFAHADVQQFPDLDTASNWLRGDR